MVFFIQQVGFSEEFADRSIRTLQASPVINMSSDQRLFFIVQRIDRPHEYVGSIACAEKNGCVAGSQCDIHFQQHSCLCLFLVFRIDFGILVYLSRLDPLRSRPSVGQQSCFEESLFRRSLFSGFVVPYGYFPIIAGGRGESRSCITDVQ